MQQAHQFRPGNRRMRIVQLDRHLRRQSAQIGMFAIEPAQDVAQRGGREEVFLLQPQFLALLGRVIRIQHARLIVRANASAYGSPRKVADG